jgi:hypothetical protein
MALLRPERWTPQVCEQDGALPRGLLALACGGLVKLCSDSVMVSAELLLKYADGIALDGYSGT